MEKRELRKLIRERKALLSQEMMHDEANDVFAFIESTDQFKHSNNILLYYSLPDELPTHDIVQKWSEIKNVFLPRVNGESLEIVPYNGDLSDSNQFHIGEPTGEKVSSNLIDLIIVPAIALTCKGHRLGRGKGFYDRLLAYTQAYTIGVALDCQLVDYIPVEPHDQRLNAIVTATHAIMNII